MENNNKSLAERLAIAKNFAAEINDRGGWYFMNRASVWNKENIVRVYVKSDKQDKGFVAVMADGTLDLRSAKTYTRYDHEIVAQTTKLGFPCSK
jgi:hypothetical protein